MLELILFGEDCSSNDLRNKNIRQTELLVDLREAILQVGRHFQVNRLLCFLCHTCLLILKFGLSCTLLFALIFLLAFFTLVCHVLLSVGFW